MQWKDLVENFLSSHFYINGTVRNATQVGKDLCLVELYDVEDKIRILKNSHRFMEVGLTIFNNTQDAIKAKEAASATGDKEGITGMDSKREQGYDTAMVGFTELRVAVMVMCAQHLKIMQPQIHVKLHTFA